MEWLRCSGNLLAGSPLQANSPCPGIGLGRQGRQRAKAKAPGEIPGAFHIQQMERKTRFELATLSLANGGYSVSERAYVFLGEGFHA